jgi:hypothetical protein
MIPKISKEVIEVAAAEWFQLDYRRRTLALLKEQNPELFEALSNYVAKIAETGGEEVAANALHLSLFVYKVMVNQSEINELETL